MLQFLDAAGHLAQIALQPANLDAERRRLGVGIRVAGGLVEVGGRAVVELADAQAFGRARDPVAQRLNARDGIELQGEGRRGGEEEGECERQSGEGGQAGEHGAGEHWGLLLFSSCPARREHARRPNRGCGHHSRGFRRKLGGGAPPGSTPSFSCLRPEMPHYALVIAFEGVMFARSWNFLKDENNRGVVQMIGGAIVVVAVGVWTAFTFFHPEEKKQPLSGPTIAIGQNVQAGRDITINPTVTIGPSEEKINKRIDDLVAQIAREKGVEAAPLRAVLSNSARRAFATKTFRSGSRRRPTNFIMLRAENKSLKKGPPQIAQIASEAQALIDKGDFDAARATLARGREAARKLREDAGRYEARMLAQESGVDHLQLAYRAAATKYGEAASSSRRSTPRPNGNGSSRRRVNSMTRAMNSATMRR